jgi:nucleotide-binding universal stress UspA family protein
MENRILIPLDGTESAEEILRYATSITQKPHTRITLLNVLSAPEDTGSPHADRIQDSLSADGWSVTRESRMGDAVEEIIKFSMLQPASMIMMSTHGRTGIERIREGSVTEQVIRQSPCPVFVLHSMRAEPPDQRSDNLFRRILVPLDGTEASAAILSCVERMARAHDSEVIIFHDEMVGPEDEERRRVIKETIQEYSVSLANKNIKVSIDMSTYKRPIREILNKIDEMNIDLVSMASHGEGGDRRAMEESVTAEVIRHANCPLLVFSADPQCPIPEGS